MELQANEYNKYINELNSYERYLIYRLGCVCLSELSKEELRGEYYDLFDVMRTQEDKNKAYCMGL
jgi:hypothetical protein